jgi:tetratricopeptide (TPR) repeat protein
MLGWSLVWLGQGIGRRLQTRSDYVLVGLLLPLLVSSYISLKKIEALSFYMSGRSYISAGKIDEGIAQMQRALNHAPEVLALEEVYPRLCLVLINKPSEFKQVAEEGLKRLPENAQLQLYMYAFKSMSTDSSDQNRAPDYLAKGKRYAATDSNIDVPLSLATVFNHLGYGFQENRDLERTVIAYRRSLQYFPNRFDTLINFAYALFDLGRMQEAREITRRAAQIDSREPRVMYLKAFSLKTKGELGAALDLALKALDAKPLNELFYLIGSILRDYKSGEAAVQFYRQTLQKPQLDSNAYGHLGLLLYGAGEREAAISAFHKALKRDEHNTAIRTNLGWLLYLDGQLQEAIAQTRRALDKRIDSHALFNLALFYLHSGEVERSRTTYAQAIEQFGAATAVEIGAVDELKDLRDQGIQVEAANKILDLYWTR